MRGGNVVFRRWTKAGASAALFANSLRKLPKGESPTSDGNTSGIYARGICLKLMRRNPIRLGRFAMGGGQSRCSRGLSRGQADLADGGRQCRNVIGGAHRATRL